MKFVCPTCNMEYTIEAEFVKHFAKCWREVHPAHRAKMISRSVNTSTTLNDQAKQFFQSFHKE